jgi:uncharacterized membrane protein
MKKETAGLLQILFVVFLNLTNFLAPLLWEFGPAGTLPLTKLIYQVWSYNCHQLPDRSFYLFGHQMPLCSRCTGIWLGSLLYCLYLIIAGKRGTDKPIKLSSFILLIAPLLIDGGTQALGWRVSDNLLRPATGILFGWACTALALPWINRFAHNKRQAFTDMWKNVKEATALIHRR